MVFIWSHRKFNTSTGCILLVLRKKISQCKESSVTSRPIQKFMFHLVLIYVAFFLFLYFLALMGDLHYNCCANKFFCCCIFCFISFSLVRTLKVFLCCTIFSIKVEHYKWIVYYKVGHKQSIRMMTNPTVIVCCLMSCFFIIKLVHIMEHTY